MSNGLKRCDWARDVPEVYEVYHDQEWGVPVHDDRQHFEMLTLEGAQAGLSWITILKKREGYRKAFHDFDPVLVSKMSDDALNDLRENPDIVRNRLKIFSVRKNASVFLQIQKEYGSFDKYVWSFVESDPVVNTWTSMAEVPVKTTQSEALSKDLKRRGMSFVGSTIMYAYMQAIGMVNDHVVGCFRYDACCGGA